MLLNTLLLIILLRISLNCRSPWVPTGIYVGVAFLLGLAVGIPIQYLAVAVLINTAFAFLYFWLLKRTEDSKLWWVVMIIGVVIVIGSNFIR